MKERATIHEQDFNFLCADHENYLAGEQDGEKMIVSGCGVHHAVMLKNLQGATFLDCDLQCGIWISADLRDTLFVRCDLSRAKFKCCKFNGATFIDCKFDDAVFDYHFHAARVMETRCAE